MISTLKDYEFGTDFYAYYKDGTTYSCVSIEHVRGNPEKFKGKELIIAHKNVPVYIRTI